ncbi:hypothetical protein [Cupriavidus sp. a3]|uniref:hypothetical protein n=1 Tax=Cupriavidus sp. a3 TaxID=3242158 RepID=UPI003D9C21B6
MRTIYLAAALIGGTAALATATPVLGAPAALFSSGTQKIAATSDWFTSVGEAEGQLYDVLDAKTDEAEVSLAAAGRRVIGHSRGTADCEDRDTDDGSTKYRCSGEVEINWVDDAAKASTGQKAKSPLAGSLSAAVAKLGMVSAGASAADGPSLTPLTKVQSLPRERIVVENYLLDQFRKKFRTDYNSMTLDSISVSQSDLVIGDVVTALPQSVNSEVYEFINGTNAQQTRTFNIGVTVVEREKFSFKKTVVTGRKETYSIKVDGSFKFGGIGMKSEGSASVEKSRTVTVGRETEEENTITRKFDESFTQNVPAQSLLFIKVQREVSNNVYSLNGGVTFDGQVTVGWRWKDVYACGIGKTDRCSRWKSRQEKVQLSQILTPAERTVDLSGEVMVSSTANTKTKISWAEKPISDLPVDSATALDPSDKVGLVDPSKFLPGHDVRKVDMVQAGLIWHNK